MKEYLNAFVFQLLIIGMVINIRQDIDYGKQILAYVLIASILPLSMLSTNSMQPIDKKREVKKWFK